MLSSGFIKLVLLYLSFVPNASKATSLSEELSECEIITFSNNATNSYFVHLRQWQKRDYQNSLWLCKDEQLVELQKIVQDEKYCSNAMPALRLFCKQIFENRFGLSQNATTSVKTDKTLEIIDVGKCVLAINSILLIPVYILTYLQYRKQKNIPRFDHWYSFYVRPLRIKSMSSSEIAYRRLLYYKLAYLLQHYFTTFFHKVFRKIFLVKKAANRRELLNEPGLDELDDKPAIEKFDRKNRNSVSSNLLPGRHAKHAEKFEKCCTTLNRNITPSVPSTFPIRDDKIERDQSHAFATNQISDLRNEDGAQASGSKRDSRPSSIGTNGSKIPDGLLELDIAEGNAKLPNTAHSEPGCNDTVFTGYYQELTNDEPFSDSNELKDSLQLTSPHSENDAICSNITHFDSEKNTTVYSTLLPNHVYRENKQGLPSEDNIASFALATHRVSIVDNIGNGQDFSLSKNDEFVRNSSSFRNQKLTGDQNDTLASSVQCDRQESGSIQSNEDAEQHSKDDFLEESEKGFQVKITDSPNDELTSWFQCDRQESGPVQSNEDAEQHSNTNSPEGSEISFQTVSVDAYTFSSASVSSDSGSSGYSGGSDTSVDGAD